MIHRSSIAGQWGHTNGRAKVGVRRSWLSLWLLGAIALLLLLNLGCNGCGGAAKDAAEEAKEAAAEAAAAAGEVIEEGAEAVGEAAEAVGWSTSSVGAATGCSSATRVALVSDCSASATSGSETC